MAKLLIMKFTPLGAGGVFYCAEDEIEADFKTCIEVAGGSCLVELLEMTEEEYERLPEVDQAADFFLADRPPRPLVFTPRSRHRGN